MPQAARRWSCIASGCRSEFIASCSLHLGLNAYCMQETAYAIDQRFTIGLSQVLNWEQLSCE